MIESNPLVALLQLSKPREEGISLIIPPLSPRKVPPMLTYQQTISPLDEKRKAGLHEQAETLVTIQDAVQSLPGNDPGLNGIKEGTAETIIQPKRDHRQFIYPIWPTSTPGPEAILPPPDQKPHPTRTDQMIYECYDQERGSVCVTLPERSVPEQTAQENGVLTKRAGRFDPFGRMRHT